MRTFAIFKPDGSVLIVSEDYVADLIHPRGSCLKGFL